MIFFPPAKINLGLRVLFKRTDGFHEIDTCMLQIPYYDILEILPSEKFSFLQSGIEIPDDLNSNLCVKAYELMKKTYDIEPVYVHLRKGIPIGAGLGGGSSDAAYVMRGIKTLFQLNCSHEDLEKLVSQLGSDCAFFIQDQSRIARGRGEILSPCSVDLKGKFLKIVNPGIHVSTKEAYQNIVISSESGSISDIVKLPLEQWKDNLHNDFESSVFRTFPSLEKIKSKLYSEGALYASMAGSGSTIYGIYSSKPGKTFQNENGYLEKIIQL